MLEVESFAPAAVIIPVHLLRLGNLPPFSWLPFKEDMQIFLQFLMNISVVCSLLQKMPSCYCGAEHFYGVLMEIWLGCLASDEKIRARRPRSVIVLFP